MVAPCRTCARQRNCESPSIQSRVVVNRASDRVGEKEEATERRENNFVSHFALNLFQTLSFVSIAQFSTQNVWRLLSRTVHRRRYTRYCVCLFHFYSTYTAQYTHTHTITNTDTFRSQLIAIWINNSNNGNDKATRRPYVLTSARYPFKWSCFTAFTNQIFFLLYNVSTMCCYYYHYGYGSNPKRCHCAFALITITTMRARRRNDIWRGPKCDINDGKIYLFIESCLVNCCLFCATRYPASESRRAGKSRSQNERLRCVKQVIVLLCRLKDWILNGKRNFAAQVASN